METGEKSNSNAHYKRGNTTLMPFEGVQNLAKKRPCSTKLDLEKMYEESLELTSNYRRLMRENEELKQEYQRVEAIKLNRQNLISVVQKIVEEKSKEISGKQANHFSWLVFKLNNKIYELRAKIDAKDRAIREITLSKESELIRQKETEIECLNQIIEFARGEGLGGTGASGGGLSGGELGEIKEIVWMEQEIKEKEGEIIQAEKAYQGEEKEVRKLMQELGRKKAELKSIKEMESEYHRAQELYREEKRKKEQRIAGNKSYLEELQNQRAEELRKLEDLKSKYSTIEQEENTAIASLQAELEKLRREYQQRIRIKQETVIKFSEEKLPEGRKKEVKRVTFEQVRLIAHNLSYSLRLRAVPHSQLPAYFSDDKKEDYSIKEVVDKLKKFPFLMQKDEDALLLARYVVEDSGDGFFLEDMDTSQNACIIKSILGKLIGELRVYSREEAEELRGSVGTVMSRFGKLVQQFLEMKEGGREQLLKKSSGVREERSAVVSRERMVEALQNSLCSLQSENFLHQQIDFTIFYLFSWSRNLNELQVARLFTMLKEGINWDN